MVRQFFILLVLIPSLGIPARNACAQYFDVDGSFGYTSAAWRLAASSQWHLRVRSRLDLGAGARLSYYGGDAKPYRNQGTTTSGVPASLPVDPDVWGVNVMVSAQLKLIGSVSAGANIDLAGLAWGTARQVGAVSLEPARGSLLLFGDNDRGSLNSEFFLAFTIGRRIHLRGGASQYVVGYHATDGATSTRYLRFDTVPFLALRLSF